MKCDDVREHYLSFLTGDLEADAVTDLESHRAGCTACHEFTAELRLLWDDLAALPPERPSEVLRARFYARLAAEQRAHDAHPMRPRATGGAWRWLESWWPQRPALQFALAVALLLGGTSLGHRLGAGANRNSEIAMLRQEVQSTRQLVTLSLLQTSSPTARLQGVGYSTQIERPEPDIVEALLSTLDADPNVNVRLAAIDALSRFTQLPEVRQRLVSSLPHQASPLVQIALIDILVASRNAQSVEALQHLVGDEQSNPNVRQRARWGLEQLL